jgi:hypothetical protein
MKPRIVQGWTSVFIGSTIQVPGWYCSGDGVSEFGSTPKEAYFSWHWTAHYNQNAYRPGAYIEQHMCPPRPTLWQKFQRIFGRLL